MTLRYIYCKWILRQIEAREHAIIRLKDMTKRYKKKLRGDEKVLKTNLKKLSLNEFFKFGVETGYIEDKKN